MPPFRRKSCLLYLLVSILVVNLRRRHTSIAICRALDGLFLGNGIPVRFRVSFLGDAGTFVSIYNRCERRCNHNPLDSRSAFLDRLQDAYILRISEIQPKPYIVESNRPVVPRMAGSKRSFLVSVTLKWNYAVQQMSRSTSDGWTILQAKRYV